MKVITDNWLVFDVADLLAGECDPGSAVLVPLPDGPKLRIETTTSGAIALLSLSNLLELIILADEIGVARETIMSWEDYQALRPLRDSGLIMPLDITPSEDIWHEYLAALVEFPPLQTLLSTAGELKGPDVYVSGTAEYLALSEHFCRVYAPHPIRGRILSKTLWFQSWPSPPGATVLDSLDATRTKLLTNILGDRRVQSISYSMSSIALCCMREVAVSQTSNVISVALQMREETHVVNLRGALRDAEAALRRNDLKAIMKFRRRIEVAIAEVERRLHLRRSSEDDGPSTLNVFSLPVRVPQAFRRPLWAPKHSGFLLRFIQGAAMETRDIVARSLGIRDTRVFESISAWQSRTG